MKKNKEAVIKENEILWKDKQINRIIKNNRFDFRLSGSDKDALDEMSQEYGIGKSKLIRKLIWILRQEKIKELRDWLLLKNYPNHDKRSLEEVLSYSEKVLTDKDIGDIPDHLKKRRIK